MTKRTQIAVVISVLLASALFAQRNRGPGRGYGYGYGYGGDLESYHNPREIPQHGGYETPTWTNTPGFEEDVFTFCRIKRDSKSYYYRRGGPWHTDAPDSDLNLSYRLQQLTAMKVNPDGLFLRLSEKNLADYPFIYMVEPGSPHFRDEEV